MVTFAEEVLNGKPHFLCGAALELSCFCRENILGNGLMIKIKDINLNDKPKFSWKAQYLLENKNYYFNVLFHLVIETRVPACTSNHDEFLS